MSKEAVILLGHGSQAEEGNTALAEVAAFVSGMVGEEVAPAYLQFKAPSLTESVERVIGAGATRVVVVPYFLYQGNHVMRDIPEELDMLRKEHPGVTIILTEHLGAHMKLAEVVVERIRSVA